MYVVASNTYVSEPHLRVRNFCVTLSDLLDFCFILSDLKELRQALNFPSVASHF